MPAWIPARVAVAVAAATIAWMWFSLPVLGLIAFLVVYHLIGTALEFRRRGYEARHQEALLEAVRHGIAVMSRAGNATSMLEALADGGPFEVRPLFKEIVLVGGSGPAGETFVRALEKIRDRVADPLFDDVVLALTLHWRQGGKLVPALEAVVNDWSETLAPSARGQGAAVGRRGVGGAARPAPIRVPGHAATAGAHTARAIPVARR